MQLTPEQMRTRGVMKDALDALQGCKRIQAAINHYLGPSLADEIMSAYDQSPDGTSPAAVDDVVRWLRQELTKLDRDT